MSKETEQAVINALRAHEGGLGEHLTEEQKKEILYGRPDKPEDINPNPIDYEKFGKGFRKALEEHNIWTWQWN